MGLGGFWLNVVFVWNSMGWCDSILNYFRGLECLWFGVIHFTVGFVG
jgi:hypothetical protein